MTSGSSPVIPAEAGLSLPGGIGIPAFAGMTIKTAALGSALLLAACGGDGAPANEGAEPAPAVPTESDVSKAERLVRERLGNPEGITFADAQRSASQGVAIVCGAFEQDGRRQRYVVIAGEEAFVEPEMEPGTMDQAFREFCAGEAEGRAQ